MEANFIFFVGFVQGLRFSAESFFYNIFEQIINQFQIKVFRLLDENVFYIIIDEIISLFKKHLLLVDPV